MGTTGIPWIQVADLRRNYGNFAAVRGIHFQVYPGEIFGLIGPDGAGKTSTFHILGGIGEASGGYVEVLGKKPRHARLDIGYLTQQFSLYLDLSIEENLRYVAGLRQVSEGDFRTRRDRYLRLMNLDRVSDRLAGQLSGGMKQKLALCCALMSRPRILLLDEPTTGVDPVSRREFWDVLAGLAGEGMTIVVATPYLDEAERCHRIALMYEGSIREIGTLAQLRERLGLQRIEARSPDIAAMEAALLPLVEVKAIADLQTFGDRLDILTPDPEKAVSILRNRLTEKSIPLTDLQITEATLENVFVNRLRQEGSDPPFIPLPRAKKFVKTGLDVAIGARDLRRNFGNFRAVKGVTVEIRYGEIYGLLGANGAGKTTTIKMLCGSRGDRGATS
jgi:ABC-2 type transport system ATP-binding protein